MQSTTALKLCGVSLRASVHRIKVSTSRDTRVSWCFFFVRVFVSVFVIDAYDTNIYDEQMLLLSLSFGWAVTDVVLIFSVCSRFSSRNAREMHENVLWTWWWCLDGFACVNISPVTGGTPESYSVIRFFGACWRDRERKRASGVNSHAFECTFARLVVEYRTVAGRELRTTNRIT